MLFGLEGPSHNSSVMHVGQGSLLDFLHHELGVSLEGALGWPSGSQSKLREI